MKKILITSRSFGSISEEPKKILEDAGMHYEFYNKEFEEAVFAEKLKDCDGLIIGAHPLSHDAVNGATKLKAVCKHGAGLDNIDLPFMEEKGIAVMNVPSTNANAVADLAFAHILNASRKLFFGATKVRAGEVVRPMGLDVYKKTLGIVGFGEIGRNVAKRAAGFSMNVLVYDPFVKEVSDEFSSYVKIAALEELLQQSDIVTLHLPLNEHTRNLVDAEQIAMMKDNAIIVNTSRGGIVNEDALMQSIESGKLAAAGLDVTVTEPLPKDSPLLKYDNITVTPHMGMYSIEATNAVSVISAQKIVDFFK